jgi:hypothetical protein
MKEGNNILNRFFTIKILYSIYTYFLKKAKIIIVFRIFWSFEIFGTYGANNQFFLFCFQKVSRLNLLMINFMTNFFWIVANPVERTIVVN